MKKKILVILVVTLLIATGFSVFVNGMEQFCEGRNSSSELQSFLDVLTDDDTIFLALSTLNNPPNTPSTPSGPTSCDLGVSYDYYISTTDPDGDDVRYGWDYNGDYSVDWWTGFHPSGATAHNGISWHIAGLYDLRAKAEDVHGAQSSWSDSLKVIVGNSPPNRPTKPDGPTTGDVGKSLRYESFFSDPDGDGLEILFDWGGGTDTGWIGVVASGTAVGNYHSWTSDGIYQVRTKARDLPYLEESEWSESLIVVIGDIQSPYADYGDAPDDSQNPGVFWNFPTLYDTVNVRIPGRRGPYHLNVGQMWLGDIESITTKEYDALIVDNDIDDCNPLICYSSINPTVGILVFHMAVAENAPIGKFYLNVLFDQNQDGEWNNSDPLYDEWIVVNRPLTIPEELRGITLTGISWAFRLKFPHPNPAWLRIMFTRNPIEMNNWDGSCPPGGFASGETEDWLINSTNYFTFPCNTKNQTIAGFHKSLRISGNDGCHAKVPCNNGFIGWLKYSWQNPGCKEIDFTGLNIHTCGCNCVVTNIATIQKNQGIVPGFPVHLGVGDTITVKIDVWWANPCNVPPECCKCHCGADGHHIFVEPIIDPVDYTGLLLSPPGNITLINPVEYYVPISYSFWYVNEEGLTNIIKYDGTESIVITPYYVTQTEYMGSCYMTWEETQHLDWIPLDETILSSGDTIEFSLPMKSGDIAAFIKYEVRYELPGSCSQNNYIDRFISEAILSNPWPTNPDLRYTITNFEVQNSLDIPVDTYELEFHGDINPSDIVDWHDPEPPGEPYLSEGTWYDGWGCPPSINTIPNGIKVTWIDTNTPIQPGQSVYFGLFVNPEVSIPTEIKGHWNIFTLEPDKPSIDGPSSGKVGVEYTYTSVTTDPDENKVLYWFDWGDDSNSGWLGPYNSGEIASAFHTWTEEDDYEIKVKAKDIYGAESPWSDPLPITMPKNKSVNPFLLFLERLIERFPILEQILQPLYDYW